MENGVTTMLGHFNGGDRQAFAHLVEAVYDDLHNLAAAGLHRKYAHRARSLTLCPTALVSNIVESLLAQRKPIQNRGQFFAIAALLVNRLISEYHAHRTARIRNYGNRGGPLEEARGITAKAPREKLDIRVVDAVAALHELDPRKAEVVTLRVVCGMTVPRIAAVLDVAPTTVERDWRFSQKWLTCRLKGVCGT